MFLERDKPPNIPHSTIFGDVTHILLLKKLTNCFPEPWCHFRFLPIVLRMPVSLHICQCLVWSVFFTLVICSDCLLLTLCWGKDSVRWLNIQHQTLIGQDSHSLVTYTHSPGEEDTICHSGPHGGCTQEWSEPVGAVGGRRCSDKRVEWPLVLMEGCDWLVWVFSWASRKLNLLGWPVGGMLLVQLVGELLGKDPFPLVGGIPGKTREIHC